MSRITAVLPLPWERALVVLPKVTGGLSLLGSSWIVMEVLRDKRKRGAVYHRLVLGMSSYCTLSSLWLFLSTWPMPVGSGWYGATGNQKTCATQGFFVSLSLAVAVYYASLSLYYLCQIRFNWRDAKFAKRVEWWVHGVAALLSLALAVVPLSFQMYRPGNIPWCHFEWNQCLREETVCGDSYEIVLAVVTFSFYITVWVCTIFSAVCMALVYRSVRDLEIRVAKYKTFPTPNQGTDPEHAKSLEMSKKSRQVAVLGMLYMSVYFLTWTIPSIGSMLVLYVVGLSEPGYMALLTIGVILYPLQGFFNWLIYIRPRFVKYMKEHPQWPSWRVFSLVIQRPLTRPNAADGDYRLGTVAEEDIGNNVVGDNDQA